MSFRGRDVADGNNLNKMDLGEPRRFGGGNLDEKAMGDESDDRRFDSGRGRRPPYGRGRRPSPPGRGDRPRDYGYGRNEPPLMRDRSPLRPPDDRFSDRYKKDDGAFPKRDDIGRKDMGRSFYGDDSQRDRFMEGRSRLDGPGNFNSRYDGPSEPYKPRSMNYPGDAAASQPPPRSFASEGFPKPNECEIIAVSKHQRAYAENVEARIKQMGILVDVLFLKDEALLTQTIDDIARRGSLYAMVISPQNETHGSVTVNILHGTPQEHRNMPLEDALKLVARNFHEHIRMQKENMERERAERGPYVGGVPADREIQLLLRMLADGRWISLSEITDVIRYLSDRREKMQATPGNDRILGRPPMSSVDVKLDIPLKPKDDLDVAQKEQDLQNRIINLMNQGAPPPVGNSQGSSLNTSMSNVDVSSSRPGQPRMNPGMNNMRSQSGIGPNMPGLKSTGPSLSAQEENLPSSVESNPVRAEAVNQPVFTNTTAGDNAPSDTAATPTYINFDNPSVQKALDNLMQSGPNLLKNISLSGTNLSNPPPSSLQTTPKSGGTGMGPANEPMGMQRGGMGPPRGGPGGMSDVPGGNQLRGSGSMDMGPPRGIGGMSDMGGPGPQRGLGSGSDMMGMGPQRGGFGGMSDMGGMNTMRGFGTGGMSDSGMNAPRMSDMGRMGGGPPHGMGPGSNFPGQGQFGKYQGPGQQGNFPGSSYNNSSNLGNMPRQNYGGNQGMGGLGGAPRRY